MTMKVFIIEDEQMAQASLVRVLKQNFSDIDIVGTVGSVRDAVSWLSVPEHCPDLIFMDVELSDGDCFEIFRQVDIKSKVVMTTAYDSYAVKAFEVNSIDYLLKPIDITSLRRAVARCRMSGGYLDMSALANALKGKSSEYRNRFIVRLNDRIVPVKSSDIAYFYSEEKNVFVVTKDSCRYVMDSSLDLIQEELDPDAFFRVSRGCIVSSSSIVSIVKQSGRLKLEISPKPAFDVVVSRSRTDEFLRWLETSGV